MQCYMNFGDALVDQGASYRSEQVDWEGVAVDGTPSNLGSQGVVVAAPLQPL